MSQKNIIIKNLKVNYYQSDVLDRDNVLVFLHGWGSEASHFLYVLKKCGNFIAIDLPGFGKSDTLREAWTIGDYADFLKNFLEKLEIRNPILAGHSFGGSVIIKYCAEGGAAKKIILIASSGIRQRSLKIYFYILLAKFGKLFFLIPGLNLIQDKAKSKLHKIVNAEDFSKLTAGELKETFKNILEEDLQEDLKKIKVSASMIWGEQDRETPLRDGLLMNKLIKNSKIFIIKNAGHYAFLDKREEFNKIFYEACC